MVITQQAFIFLSVITEATHIQTFSLPFPLYFEDTKATAAATRRPTPFPELVTNRPLSAITEKITCKFTQLILAENLHPAK